jgi:hypothetical protein
MPTKTVWAIYIDALFMAQRGLPLPEITRRLTDIARNAGFDKIGMKGAGNVIAMRFHATGETIRYDGASWYYAGPLAEPGDGSNRVTAAT